MEASPPHLQFPLILIKRLFQQTGPGTPHSFLFFTLLLLFWGHNLEFMKGSFASWLNTGIFLVSPESKHSLGLAKTSGWPWAHQKTCLGTAPSILNEIFLPACNEYALSRAKHPNKTNKLKRNFSPSVGEFKIRLLKVKDLCTVISSGQPYKFSKLRFFLGAKVQNE